MNIILATWAVACKEARTLAVVLGIAALGALCGPAQAYPIDLKIGQALLANSGDTTEKNALAAILNLDPNSLTLDFKYDDEDSPFNFSVNPDGGWFIDVAPATPGYFILKFGISTGATADHFFFENVADLGKLAWTNDQVQYLTGGDCGANNANACNIGRLSHYVGFNGPNMVPEPATLALAGIALLGMVAARRRRR